MPFKNTEVQPELFGSLKKNRGPCRVDSRWFSGNFNSEISISCDTLIVIVIAVVMTNLLMYVFGIEQGKQLAKQPASSPVRITRPGVAMQVAATPPAKPPQTQTAVELPAPLPDRTADNALDEEAAALSRGYVIQLVTYSKDKTAQREVERLQTGGTKSFYLKKGKFFVVYAGKFPSKETAAATLNNLRKDYRDCILTYQNQES